MAVYVRRIGQQSDPTKEPSYRLVQDLHDHYLVEYCNVWQVLPKELYERVKP